MCFGEGDPGPRPEVLKEGRPQAVEGCWGASFLTCKLMIRRFGHLNTVTGGASERGSKPPNRRLRRNLRWRLNEEPSRSSLAGMGWLQARPWKSNTMLFKLVDLVCSALSTTMVAISKDH